MDAVPRLRRRPRARQRQDHPGTRIGVPRRGLERHQGGRGDVRLDRCGHVVQRARRAIFHEAIAAADLLRGDWGVHADLWSCPSFTELARDGNAAARWNLLHPDEAPRRAHVTHCLADTRGPVIAATDYVRALAEQIRPFVPRAYTVLGTDGFGRSDTREKLRHFFEVDRRWITLAALKALVEEGALERGVLHQAIEKYGIDPEKPNPLHA